MLEGPAILLWQPWHLGMEKAPLRFPRRYDAHYSKYSGESGGDPESNRAASARSSQLVTIARRCVDVPGNHCSDAREKEHSPNRGHDDGSHIGNVAARVGRVQFGAMPGLPIACSNDILNIDVEAISSDDKVEISANGVPGTSLKLTFVLFEFGHQRIEFVRGSVGEFQETLIVGGLLSFDCFAESNEDRFAFVHEELWKIFVLIHVLEEWIAFQLIIRDGHSEAWFRVAAWRLLASSLWCGERNDSEAPRRIV